MKKNKTTPRYSKGTKVLLDVPGLQPRIVRINNDEPTHDGEMWVYAFQNESYTCGERFLHPCDQSAPTGLLKAEPKPTKHTFGEQMQYPITSTIEIKRNAHQR